jgi:hypothetical protein
MLYPFCYVYASFSWCLAMSYASLERSAAGQSR